MDERVAICVPTYTGEIKAETVTSIVQALYTSKCKTLFLWRKGVPLPFARTALVEKARELSASHVFFVDDDNDFPQETLMRLLSYDKDVVGANYHMKKIFENNEKRSTVRMKNPEGVYTISQIPFNSIFECDAVATGCMLIKMSVFDIIDKPWFFYPAEEAPGGGYMTEDVWFCEQVKKKGLKVWCDSGLDVGHWGDYRY